MKLFTIACFLFSAPLSPVFQNQADRALAASGIRGQTFLNRAGIILPTIEIELAADGVSRRTITDEVGRYEFGGLRAGKYLIKALAPGFVVREMTVELGSGEHRLVNLALDLGRNDLPGPKPNEITGLVQDVNQVPLVDATVVFLDPYNNEPLGRALTDSAGRYTLRSAGSLFVVYAAKPGFAPRTLILSFDGQWSHSTDHLDLTLVPLRSVRR